MIKQSQIYNYINLIRRLHRNKKVSATTRDSQKSGNKHFKNKLSTSSSAKKGQVQFSQQKRCGLHGQTAYNIFRKKPNLRVKTQISEIGLNFDYVGDTVKKKNIYGMYCQELHKKHNQRNSSFNTPANRKKRFFEDGYWPSQTNRLRAWQLETVDQREGQSLEKGIKIKNMLNVEGKVKCAQHARRSQIKTCTQQYLAKTSRPNQFTGHSHFTSLPMQKSPAYKNKTTPAQEIEYQDLLKSNSNSKQGLLNKKTQGIGMGMGMGKNSGGLKKLRYLIKEHDRDFLDSIGRIDAWEQQEGEGENLLVSVKFL